MRERTKQTPPPPQKKRKKKKEELAVGSIKAFLCLKLK